MDYLVVPRLKTQQLRRVFTKIRVDPTTGCWLWTAGRTTTGYGKVKFLGRTELAHRLLWAWLVGPLPQGQHRDIPNLDHRKCDTKNCCFPAHLELVAPRENTLRSDRNPTAINSRRTHCAKGHLLPSEARYGEGRACHVCRKQWHTSDRYKQWNADFGRANHQQHRYGPEREDFLRRKREYMREWRLRKKESGAH